MKYNLKVMTLMALCLLTGKSAMAQDSEEFQRIVTRYMDAYDAESGVGKDSLHWHGRAYVGASSQSRVMPYGSFVYRVGRGELSGNISFDVSEKATYRDELTTFTSSDASINTGTDIMTRYEHQDASLTFKYSLAPRQTLILSASETYNHDNIQENSIKSKRNDNGDYSDSEYEEQVRKARNLTYSTRVSHQVLWRKGSGLTSELDFMHQYKPTKVLSDTWAAHTPETVKEEEQDVLQYRPYAIVRYTSPKWGGFDFNITEKADFSYLRITDTATEFSYQTGLSNTALTLNYKLGPLTLKTSGVYEHFRHRIHKYSALATIKSYDDWLYSWAVTMKVARHHSVLATYDRTIKRPSYTQLYPYVHIGSSIGSWVVGNAELEPSTSHQWRFSYIFNDRHWTVNSYFAYQRIDDDITKVSTYNEEVQRTVKTWINDARYNIYRFGIEGSLKSGPFSMTMGARAQKLDYTGEKVTNDHAWSYSFKARPQVVLPAGWTLAMVLLYTGREVHQHYYDRSNMYVALRAAKQLGPWAVYAFVQDIFEENYEQVLRNTNNAIVTNDDRNARALVVGCSYRF